jgi:hypothetical protein
MWYIYKMEHCLAIKKVKIMAFTGKWMEMEIIIFREISQAQEDKYLVFHSHVESRPKK